MLEAEREHRMRRAETPRGNPNVEARRKGGIWRTRPPWYSSPNPMRYMVSDTELEQ